MRIVSLLPSATEILFGVGAGDDVVGVTLECDHPAAARTRTVASTTTLPAVLSPAEIDAAVRERLAAGEDLYRLDEGALRGLDPDVVVTQDLCAVCAVDVENVDAALAHLGCRAEVVTLDPMTLDDVLVSIERVGAVTGTDEKAGALVNELRSRLAAVAAAVAGRSRPRMALLEWTDPPFAPGHWLPDMVTAAGAHPVIGAAGERSRPIGWADLAAAQPDQVVVVPCGYRLDGAAALTADLVAQGLLPTGAEVWAVDADAAFVRPGPRVVDGVETLAGIAHPGAVEVPADLARRVS